MARRLFSARTTAEVLAKAQQWVDEHDVFLNDVSWNWAHDEPEPFTLAVYFTSPSGATPSRRMSLPGRDRTVHPPGRQLRNLPDIPRNASQHVGGRSRYVGGLSSDGRGPLVLTLRATERLSPDASARLPVAWRSCAGAGFSPGRAYPGRGQDG